MVKSGQSQKLVAQKLNIGKRTLERWWADHKKTKKLSSMNILSKLFADLEILGECAKVNDRTSGVGTY